MTLYLLFCKNCSWEILAMLIGAWLLGWLFWWLFHRPGYMKRIASAFNEKNALSAQLNAIPDDGSKGQIQLLKNELESAKLQNKNINKSLNSLMAELENAKSDVPDPNNDISLLKNTIKELKLDNLDLQNQLKASNEARLKAEIEADKYRKQTLTDTSYSDEATSEKETPSSAPDYATLLDSCDLKIVEGVGPKIESLLNAGGLNNWADLAHTDPSRIQSILNEAGPRYRVHDPKTWTKQARLAHENKWPELIAIQKGLGGTKSNQSKVEKLYMKARGIKAFAPDDLKIVEGIGPKIEGLLKADGINDWVALANAKVDRIKAILTAAGERYRLAEPTTWPKQAGMASAGDWEALKAYQDRLKGGKE